MLGSTVAVPQDMAHRPEQDKSPGPNDSDPQPAGVALPTTACVLGMSSCMVPDGRIDSDLIAQASDSIATLNKACSSQ